MNIEQILNNVDEYYSAKVQTYGASPQGVDWNSMESQNLRFKQVLNVCEESSGLHHSILDYGCGYGAMADFILANRYQLEYEGLDISAEMIREARLCHPTMDPNRFHLGPIQGLKADYVVASGIFNVKQGCSENTWQEYVVDTIEKMASMNSWISSKDVFWKPWTSCLIAERQSAGMALIYINFTYSSAVCS